MVKKIEILCTELKENLVSNILQYWMTKMVDPNGGFYGERDGNDMLVLNAPKGAILNGRLLWTFAAAYRTTRDNKYLEMANRAKRYILDNFYDNKFGGIYWSVDSNGNPLDTKKQFYAIGFVIYGLSELVRANGDPEALEYAKRLYYDIECHSHDFKKGGYIEACTRDWSVIEDMRLSEKDANEKKTMNTHLHIIEPYTNLYRVWESDELKDSIRKLLNLFLDKIENPVTHHLGLFYDEDWNRQDNIISYGHDIEASWLLLETADVLGEKSIYNKTLKHTYKIAKAALDGRMADGSMVYECHNNGMFDNERHWWVQAECVIGLIYLYKYHKESNALDKAIETWNFIKSKLVDDEHGEWHWSILNDGSINYKDDKAGFWKCPYHNSRMCMEVIRVLSK